MKNYTKLIEMSETALSCAKELCDELADEYTVKTLPIAGAVCYIQGVLLLGYQKLYKATGEKKYYDYAKQWVDYHLTPNGEIIDDDRSVPYFTLGTLDYRQPGTLMFDIYDDTHDERYKNALVLLAETMKDFPKNSKGSFWHNDYSTNQVWLDGLYMISPLLAHYAQTFDKPEWFDAVATQITNMYDYMRNDDGLLLHGWCEDKSAKWADCETGLSPTVWARACGWVVAAIADILDYFPKSHEKYERIAQIQNNLLSAISRYQDSDGLWHQVLDKPENGDNPQESSATGLFLYAAAKGMRCGYVTEDYSEMIARGLDGILKCAVKRDENGKIVVGKICAGLCIETGTYEHYVKKAEFIDNDSHGTGVFVQMCTEVYEFCKSLLD